MSPRQVGQEVMTAKGWSVVIGHLHSDTEGSFKYFSLHTTMGSISLTGDHLLRVQRNFDWQWRRAKDVRLGDFLEDAQGVSSEVLKITCINWQGAFAPLTLSGELLVDGRGEGVLTHARSSLFPECVAKGSCF